MSPPAHTTGGHEKRCLFCGNLAIVDPSIPPGDAVCPFRGSLLWILPPEPPQHDEQYWPQAIERLRQCVRFVPDNVMYRQLLRNCEHKHLGQSTWSCRVLRKQQLRKLESRLQAAHDEKNWDAVDQAAEAVLAVAPWDVDANVVVGEVAEERAYVDVARFAYVIAFKSAPDREDLKEKLAELGYNVDQ